MSHPPIPPGCEYFTEGIYGYQFSICGISPVTLRYARKWRPIIAAVAEVAWHVEAERLWREDCQHDPDRGYMRTPEVAQAEANAAAWREWGKQGAP